MIPVTLAPPKLSVPPDVDEAFASPLFREVAALFDDTTRRVILEPGATSAGTLALLRGKRCRLLVADAARALSALDEKSEDTQFFSRQVSKLIFDAGAEKVDTVLCWDLLNYLSPPLMKAFSAHLATLMTADGVVHAYIHTGSASMPRYPQRYSVAGEDCVLRLDRDPAVREAPRYSFRDLERHLVGLRVERSMLLRNGTQEYLLRVDGEGAEGDRARPTNPGGR